MRHEGLTVLIPTSPIPSCPSTEVIDATYRSIRERLPDVPIVIACDGYHEGACTEEAYTEYVDRLSWGGAYRTTVLRAPEWLHEANLTRLALPLVDTDLLLFVEHDNPLDGPDLPWDGLARALRSGAANMIRLSLEGEIPEVWRYLYPDGIDEPVDVEGVPLLRTIQWSTRPYLTRTDWISRIHEDYVGDDSRHFLETVLHAVLANRYRVEGDAGWDAFRVWMYAPEGDIRRALHTDGRQDAPERLVTIGYPGGETPWGAPAPVVEVPQ